MKANSLVADDLRGSLAVCLNSTIDAVQIQNVAKLPSHLGNSTVFRIMLKRVSGNLPSTVILKIPEAGNNGPVKPGDPLVLMRERKLAESGLLFRLPSDLRPPRVYGIDDRTGKTWIWMEDLSECLTLTWNPSLAVTAAQQCSSLHTFYQTYRAELNGLPWLAKRLWAFYSHYIATCHANLEACARDRFWRTVFGEPEIAALHECLNSFNQMDRLMSQLAQSFLHGDFHIRNLGFDRHNALVMVDWAHVGISPLGCDIASFSSMYRLLGGIVTSEETSFERLLVDAYCKKLTDMFGVRVSAREVQIACSLWHKTAGLHLRLGPGLSALLLGKVKDAGARDRIAQDIRDGCRRVLNDSGSY